MNIIRDIRDVASRMITSPLLAWILSHIGIDNNEIADRAARQALMNTTIDIYISMSKARTRRNIKHTARDIYETLEVVGRNRVRWSAAQLSNESALPRTTDSTP